MQSNFLFFEPYHPQEFLCGVAFWMIELLEKDLSQVVHSTKQRYRERSTKWRVMVDEVRYHPALRCRGGCLYDVSLNEGVF